MSDVDNLAPGWPGIPPRWTSSAKSGIGTSLSPSSRVWFTLSHGIFNEIYYPRVDQACIRDLGLIVTDGQDYFSEEKRHANSKLGYLVEGVPAYRLVNTCSQGRYQIEKQILSDPRRDAVLQWTRFTPLQGKLDDYHVFALLAPHIGNRGMENTAWVGDYKGVPMLFAERNGNALALACSAPWVKRSAGFVGVSDGWQDLNQHKVMEWTYERAENGNVALTGEIDLSSGAGEFLLVLGFGNNPAEAGHRALASLQDGFDRAKTDYLREWQEWQEGSTCPKVDFSHKEEVFAISTMILRTHEAKRIPGGLIASLSIPWGFAKGDDDLGGYHLVWPRDLVEAVGGLVAAGAHQDVWRVLRYLQATQEDDGHWPQNMWLDGTCYWGGVQMDETAFPILLVDLARREQMLIDEDLTRFWPMVRRAASFLVLNGPVTAQDRWEEDPGYSPFTLAVEIAALLVAADLAEVNGEKEIAGYLRDTADSWNDSIEHWIYVTGTDLARQVGVDGYYVRIAPPEISDAASPAFGFVPIKNRPVDQSSEPAAHIVSPDALALVRFGLRAPDDPRILNTVKIIDSLLKVETPSGPAWHRYNDDGYGEHADGSAFDGTGIGRLWPLLTGERAHYELACGQKKEAERLLKAMEAFGNDGGLIPEQVWDAPDIPARELYFGRPSGSAMPLVWAHAEYIKLLRSLQDGKVFDTPPQTVQRYQVEKKSSPICFWRFNHKTRLLTQGRNLRIELPEAASIRFSRDGWATTQEAATRDSHLGVYYADLPAADLKSGATLAFTFYWPDGQRWEGVNYQVQVEGE
ncbi:MAG: glucan 1,4-alpha-glucosidase [Chloroflexi bacterium]|nr:glucan 1,4-alpha-glucosidase [Chloroflexota bacterium]